MDRICPKCRESKALTEFAPNRREPGGYRPECRACYRAYLKAWRERNVERKRAADRAYYAANPDRVQARAKQWRLDNPERAKATDDAYRAAKGDQIKVRQREKRDANRDAINAAKREWRKANLARAKELERAYRQRNHAAVLADRALRKARKRLATPPWLTKEHKAVMREAYSQAVTASEVLGEPYHVDHIVPLGGTNVCGLHVPWNLRVITAAGNILKSNRLEE